MPWGLFRKYSRLPKVSLHPHQPLRRGRAVDVGRDKLLNFPGLQPHITPQPGYVLIKQHEIPVHPLQMRPSGAGAGAAGGLLPLLWDSMVFLQPLRHGWQPIAATGALPLTDQYQQFGAHGHQPERGFGAIEVVIDLVANGGFNGHHFSS
jgi:hypothetical protein